MNFHGSVIKNPSSRKACFTLECSIRSPQTYPFKGEGSHRKKQKQKKKTSQNLKSSGSCSSLMERITAVKSKVRNTPASGATFSHLCNYQNKIYMYIYFSQTPSPHPATLIKKERKILIDNHLSA